MQRSKNTLYLPALTEYRAKCVRRRAEAFCDAPEYVLGIEVMPLTPATFSMLVATGSAFIMGGQPQEHDVRNYLWFHSPLYRHTGFSAWRVRKAIALFKFSFQVHPLWCRMLRKSPPVGRYIETLSVAIAEISRLIDDAFADAPPKSGRPGKPIATTEAYFSHEFSSSYHWPTDKTRHTPLRQLIQLHRCIRSSRGEEISDDGEDRILAAHMDEQNAKLATLRKAA